MPARRLLFVNATRVTAYHWLPSGPKEEASFAANEPGLSAFRDYLRERSASLFYLLADLAEEGFQVDELPHVQGNDRRELIKRKLAQYYYGTPLSLALSLGRSKKGRRDEKFLFAGLLGVSQIEPWLQAMRETEARLAGIHSMPFVIAALVGKLPAATERILVISASSAGLRQSFFENGQLRFSRLTAMATDRSDLIATTCASEAGKIYQYLAGQRLISRDQPLQVLVLAHADNAHWVEINRPPTRRPILSAPADAANAAPAVSAEDRRFYRQRARHALTIVSATVFGACLLLAGGQMLRLSELSDRNAQVRLDVETGQRRYDDLMRGLPPIDISRDSLRDLTDRYRVLARRSAGPEPLLRHLGHALDQAPRVD
jgi:hypothetical protein